MQRKPRLEASLRGHLKDSKIILAHLKKHPKLGTPGNRSAHKQRKSRIEDLLKRLKARG